MAQALYPLVLLACPIGMGLMMWVMMRGGSKGNATQPPSHDVEIAQLRAEVERLRTQQEGHQEAAPARGGVAPS